jgi:hypothetical protein
MIWQTSSSGFARHKINKNIEEKKWFISLVFFIISNERETRVVECVLVLKSHGNRPCLSLSDNGGLGEPTFFFFFYFYCFSFLLLTSLFYFTFRTYNWIVSLRPAYFRVASTKDWAAEKWGRTFLSLLRAANWFPRFRSGKSKACYNFNETRSICEIPSRKRQALYFSSALIYKKVRWVFSLYNPLGIN